MSRAAIDAAVSKGRQNVLAETRLKIAVFIDFDNIEIGVKSTLGVQFDIGVVLEALKERGDVVSKIAYGDWTRAGDYSRSLTQHATKLVQRNLTPGGDKNGADINLALDALEMAFTHGHINAYVIVGGDSDFITLVEKLKQYDKQIFVVGGRAFTSMVMQRNCHEFIAYENLVGSRRSRADRGRPSAPVVADADRSGRAARAPRAQGADRSRSVAAARAAQEHAAAARLDVLRADVRRRQLPRFRAEARVGRPRHASRVGPQRTRRAAEGSGAVSEDARLPPQYSQPQSRREPRSRRRVANPSSRRRAASRGAAGGGRAVNGGEPRPRTGSAKCAGCSSPREPAAMADVHPSGEAVPSQRGRDVRRAQVRIREPRRPAARVSARRTVPHRARSSGRDAAVPRQRRCRPASQGAAAGRGGRRRRRQSREREPDEPIPRPTNGSPSLVGADASARRKSSTAMSSRRSHDAVRRRGESSPAPAEAAVPRERVPRRARLRRHGPQEAARRPSRRPRGTPRRIEAAGGARRPATTAEAAGGSAAEEPRAPDRDRARAARTRP